MLPCNVMVQEICKEEVTTIKPMASISAVDNLNLYTIAMEVRPEAPSS